LVKSCRKYTNGDRVDNVDYLLNRESGLKGLAETDSDSIYEISHMAAHGDKEMMNVLRFYAYRIKKYIGAYRTILGRVDAIVFTGTVGYRSGRIKRLIVSGLKDMKNIEKLVVKTDEELMIAREIIKISKAN